MKFKLFLSATILALFSSVFAEMDYTIDNTLGMKWPWELTHITAHTAAAGKLSSVQLPNGEVRPVQRQTTDEGTRLWFVATLGKDTSHTVTFTSDSAPSGITTRDTGTHLIIDNGMYEFRLRKSQSFDTPIPLNNAPHWNGGARMKGTDDWDGRAWFEGNGLVKTYTMKLLQQGPVFIDAEVTYEFDTTVNGTTDALPLELGKQTHTWEPDTPPRETLPKKDHAYTVRLRFVMGDPWIEVNERFHLPPAPGSGPYGIHQYWMNWGKPQDVPDISGFESGEYMDMDVVTWVRWFLYDKFGGNTNQNWVPAEPRQDQKGRPFALLRPRWNQGGGGAQDFVVTSGGKNPPSINWLRGRHLKRDIQNLAKKGSAEEKAKLKPLVDILEDDSRPYLEQLKAARTIGEMVGKEVRLPDDNFSTDNPAVGLVAAFASKWVGPYPATIATYVYDGNRARARFPLRDGERSGMHYGQRAYALCIGPRSEFNHLNSLVRRHTDWTLVAQMNKYVLDWERDPSKAGPNAKITRNRLQELRQAYRSGRGMEGEIMREASSELDRLLAGLDKARDDKKSAREAKDKEAENAANKDIKAFQKKLESSDMQLLRMIAKDWSKGVKIPTAELWLQRRYQDDFLNPTQRTPRSIAEYANADLFAAGEPLGGPKHAALGYITTDLDAWPGWHQGWSPGNPNFHTDKYMGAIYIATAMRDHPHSDEWLAFGWNNFNQDIQKVLLPPDGTGYECPGYSGYSLGHQLDLARIFVNAGYGNPVAENPLFKGTGRWHRKLITPYDHRIKRRHAAPIGDTHRWDSGLKHGFGKLAAFYTEADPSFASEMQGTWKLLTDNGLKVKEPLKTRVLYSDASIKPMDPMDMDWSGEVFHGFGALMRDKFGTEKESFVSLKAGPLRGHYHNDELSYHFYANGHPVSLDYNCSYTPRGDHAALHNSMTFGREATINHNKRNDSIPAMEQIFASAWPGAFASTSGADVVVAERKQSGLTMSPLYPKDHEFGRGYPSRKTGPIVHRRFLALVKHPENSGFSDYLVVREETQSDQAQAVNIHLLGREARQEGDLILVNGQYDMDMAVYVAEATGLEVEHRHWSYQDEWMLGPGEEYEYRPGETQQEWAERMEALKREHGVDRIPLPGWKPRWKQGRDAPNPFVKLVRETDGKAMMPPPGWSESWLYGEYQHWLRLNTEGGTPVLWVLYPYPKGTEPPSFEALADGTGVRVTLNGKSEDVFLATSPAQGMKEQAVLKRDGKTHVLLGPNAVPGELGAIPQKPLADN